MGFEFTSDGIGLAAIVFVAGSVGFVVGFYFGKGRHD